jgi:zinc protease
MKKLIYTFALISAASSLTQVQAQQHPAYDMMIDGVKVIVQPSGNNIVQVETMLRGGVLNYPANKMGIEAMAMNALTECGTLQHDKNSFKNILDKVSGSVYAYTGKDYATISMNCIKTDFDIVWPLYGEAITQPKFDTTEFTRIKQDAINNLKEQDSQPDQAIDKLANKVAFAGRDFAKDPQGTALIISGLTAAETKAYYYSILSRSRMLVVVVADLDSAVIASHVKTMLNGIKLGQPFEMKKSFFRVYKNSFNAEPRDLATNYIEGVTSGPEVDAPDFDAFNMAMQIFSDRHFLNIRTNNGLSYAPQSWFEVGSTSVVKFAVSTTEPNRYIAVFDKLVDSTRQHGFNAAEVADMKVTYLTGFYYKNETNEAQASSIADNEIMHGNWKRSLNLMDNVKKLTVEQINDAFNKYVGNTVWVYQGDVKKVNPILYSNGTSKAADNPVSN